MTGLKHGARIGLLGDLKHWPSVLGCGAVLGAVLAAVGHAYFPVGGLWLWVLFGVAIGAVGFFLAYLATSLFDLF